MSEMTRTLINIPEEDKQWLDDAARERQVPMTELVREAVREYRVRQESIRRPDLAAALRRSSGVWRKGDGLAWQEHLRDEWERS